MEILELKSTITQIKNSMVEINRDRAKETISGIRRYYRRKYIE